MGRCSSQITIGLVQCCKSKYLQLETFRFMKIFKHHPFRGDWISLFPFQIGIEKNFNLPVAFNFVFLL